MLNGLYTATSGMLMQQTRLDVISNNLANVSTTGFKKEQAVFSVFRPNEERLPQTWIRDTLYNKSINTAVILDEIYTNHENGELKETGNVFDLALVKENAFFSIDTPWGVRYTRAGDFTMNENGDLVTREGYPVMSNQAEGAPINIPDGTYISTDREGNIYSDGVVIDALGIAEFDDLSYLQKVGRNLFAAVDIEPTPATSPQVYQGFLEDSNVNPISEMVRMIDASRGYEIYSKVVQTHDQILSTSANKIAEMG